ncbi:MAG: hypothetical protein M3O68_07780 [Thermoproteota archaeon]|nr:hypothetical protein [Thermoproteota archaeon]
MEPLVVSSLIFSVVAMVLSLARILRSYREGKRKRQSDLFSNVTNITRIIDDEKFIRSRRALRKNKLLNHLKEGSGNENLLLEIGNIAALAGVSSLALIGFGGMVSGILLIWALKKSGQVESMEKSLRKIANSISVIESFQK